MRKEHKGQVYLAILYSDVLPLVRLRCPVYVFLPLNDRMVKVRASDQVLEPEALAAFEKHGHPNLYILDPQRHAGSFDFSSDQHSALNPKISEEVEAAALALLHGNDDRARRAGESEEDNSEKKFGVENVEEEQIQLGTAALMEEEQRLSGATEGEVIQKVHGGEKNVEDENRLQGGGESTNSSVRISNNKNEVDKTENSFGNDSETSDGTQGFSSEAKVDDAGSKRNFSQSESGNVAKIDGSNDSESEKRFAAEKSEGRGGGLSRTFAAEDPAETGSYRNENSGTSRMPETLTTNESAPAAQQNFESDRSETPERIAPIDTSAAGKDMSFGAADLGGKKPDVFGGEAAKNPKTQKKAFEALQALRDKAAIAAMGSEAEEKMFPTISSDAGGKRSTTKIAREIAEAEKALVQANPEEQAFLGASGLMSTELTVSPATRTALALNGHVAKLRAEARATGAGIIDPEELSARRQKLAQEVARIEEVSALLVELEDQCAGVPSAMQKPHLLAKLNQNLRELQGSRLVSASDLEAIEKKLETLREEDNVAADASEAVLGSELVERLKKVRDDPTSVGSGTLAKLNKEVAKKLRNAEAAANIAEAIAESRKEILDRIVKPPKSREEQNASEAAAVKIQREVHRMESIAEAIASGAEVPERELEPFLKKRDRRDSFSGSENVDDEARKVLAESEALARTAGGRRKAAQAAEKELREKLFGKEPSVSEEMEESSEGADHGVTSEIALDCAVDIAALDRARDRILDSRSSGKEADAEHTKKIREGVVREIQQAQLLIEIEKKLSDSHVAMSAVLEAKNGPMLDDFERETQAFLIKQDIGKLQALKEKVRSGTPFAASSIQGFVPQSPPMLPAGATPADQMNQLLSQLAQVKRQAVAATVASANAEAAARRSIGSAGSSELKAKSVKTKNIDQFKKVVGRQLRAFLETGTEPNPTEIWDINKAITRTMMLAEAEEKIARKITSLVEERVALKESNPSGHQEREAAALRAKEISGEIQRLEGIARSLDSGERVEAKILAPYLQELPKPPQIEAGASLAESFARVEAAMLNSKESLVSAKIASLEASSVNKVATKPESQEERVFEGARSDTRGKDEKDVHKGAKADHRGGAEKDVHKGAKADHRFDEERRVSSKNPSFSAKSNSEEGALTPGSAALKDSMKLFTGAKSDHRNDDLVFLKGDGNLGVTVKEPETAIERNEEFSGQQDTNVKAGEEEKTHTVNLGSDDERSFQAGVYAVQLFRAFGYRSEELEQDLILACILARIPDEKIQSLPGRTVVVHQACNGHAPQDEMVLRDLAQAALLAREYLAQPGVVTGAYAFHQSTFADFCQYLMEARDSAADPVLLERARQSVARGFFGARDREDLVYRAKQYEQKISRWRKSAAS